MFAFALGEIRTKQRKVANVSCRSCWVLRFRSCTSFVVQCAVLVKSGNYISEVY